MTSISRHGYGLLKASMPESDIQMLRDELTVKPYDAMATEQSKPIEFPLYRENDKKIYVPKAYGLKKFGVPAEDNLPHGDDINLEFLGTIRDIQTAPIATFLKHVQSPNCHGGVISLPCGSGKTVIALKLLASLGKKTIIIVHKEFLIDQWRERIETFLPMARVGLIKAQCYDVQNKDIVIASLQSLSMKTYDKSAFVSFGLMIVDEVHRTGAQVFSRVYTKINTRLCLGLSATVNRKDGLTKVFKWHIGDVLYKGAKTKDDGVKVLVKEYYDPRSSYCHEHKMYNGRLNMPKLINAICSFQPRQQYIVDCLQELLQMEPERKVLVLSDRRGHLEELHGMFTARGLTSGFYYGGLSQETLKESEGKQILLGTYSYVSEGFDMKGLNTMVLASPKSDVIQSVGRILRDAPSQRTFQPVVIDIADMFSIFKGQTRKRIKYYNSQGYNVVTESIHQSIDESDFKGSCLIIDDA